MRIAYPPNIWVGEIFLCLDFNKLPYLLCSQGDNSVIRFLFIRSSGLGLMTLSRLNNGQARHLGHESDILMICHDHDQKIKSFFPDEC